MSKKMWVTNRSLKKQKKTKQKQKQSEKLSQR